MKIRNATRNEMPTARTLIAMLCAVGLLLAGVAGAEPAGGKVTARAKAKNKGEYLLPKAKAAGQVGEQLDGYLGLIDENSPEQIKKMVVDTNERRKGRYTEAARKRGSSVESVGQIAGQKFASRVKPGEMWRGADGKWVKK